MPTINRMNLPPPNDWQEFESIVRDALSQLWKSPRLQKNGRLGQKQHGVDIWGPDDIGRPVGIQCKLSSTPLELKNIGEEIEKAEQFEPRLTTFYVATMAHHDSILQQRIRNLSDKRTAAGKFAVAIIFWDEIVNGLLRNESVFNSHYPQILLTDTVSVDTERQIAALELGYYGANIWEGVLLTFGEFGLMAQTDPDELFAKTRIIERRAAQLLSPEDAVPIVESCKAVKDGCISPKKDDSDWDVVEVYAKRVQDRSRTASSHLSNAEANALEVGVHLSHTYFHVDDWPNSDVTEDIERRVRNLLSSNDYLEIDAAFARAAKLSSAYMWARRLYTFVDREIRLS